MVNHAPAGTGYISNKWGRCQTANRAFAFPCRSCRRLRSFDLAFKNQSQKIAACGSSYRCGVSGGPR
ncbi:hypothetical protein CGA21_09395 [Pseudomonas sp. PSB11]|nr:hypothetical protein [Pseudomonas sp. PSB11]